MGRKFLILGCILLATSSIKAQVGIGTESPIASAILDIDSDDKGVIFPRVALTGRLDKNTILNPEPGLMVYNKPTSSSTFKVEGYVYWSGENEGWKIFNSSQIVAPTIATFNCGNAELLPTKFHLGPFDGTLRVQYTGGNGGSYPAGDPYQSNGFTMQLQAGTLEYGIGFLTYSVNHPNCPIAPSSTANLEAKVNFMSTPTSCTATVGEANAEILTKTWLGPMRPVAAAPGADRSAGAEFRVETMDGRYSLRFYCRSMANAGGVGSESLTQTDIQIRHNLPGVTKEPIIIMHQFTYSDDMNANGNPRWEKEAASGVSDNAFEVYGAGAGNDTSAGELRYDQNEMAYMNEGWHLHRIDGWRKHGDPAVYSNGRPEYRIMIFTPADQSVKRIYRYTFFFGAPDGFTSFNAYGSTKCWVYGEEIVAE